MALTKLQWVLLSVVVLLACSVAARKYNSSKTYVHIVPHTHDDVGWLKTVDQYFYGANKSIQQAAVQYILDTVVEELQLDSKRTFIYVEMAFFTRWWNQQNDATKQVVKNLVKNKQLEFVNAGWCMNDEAGTHYNAIIDQMTAGLQFVEENFGADARPRVAWHIDPFGHSSEQAAIFAMMGYDGFFFARNDYDDRKRRLANKTMEMVWRPSQSLGMNSDLFTGILYYGYGPPPGFCFDMKCKDDPIQDDPNLMDYNVDQKVEGFVKAIAEQQKSYRHNQVMLTMGEDFQWESAREWYKNLDKLMKYTMEKHPELELFYSTPTRYIDAVYEADLEWTVKTDDFFPYADHSYAYWTGYFTSRPALKGYTRKMNSLLQTCSQCEVWADAFKIRPTTSSAQLAEAMGLDQHHDAVSGTEKQHVANDYAKRLHIGQDACTTLIQEVVGGFMATKNGGAIPSLQYCEYLNISVCPASEAADSFDVVVYNPLAVNVTTPVRFPVKQGSPELSVMSDTGKMMTSQIQPETTPTTTSRGAPLTLTFVDTLPALGVRTYFVRPAAKLSNKPKRPQVHQRKLKLGGQDIQIGDSDYPIVVTFDGVTGHMKSINNTALKLLLNIDQWFLWYNSSDGHNINSTQPSGAYIFRPNGTQPFDVTSKGVVSSMFVAKGEVYMELYQEFTPWLYQYVRVYKELPLVQLQYTVGPIPILDDLGKEVISRFTTDMKTDETWYTDANGREMQKRRRNYRPTWVYNNTEPVAGNYYPVNSRMYMRDESRGVQLTVMTDRSQGGSSLNDGQMELMVHRRTLYDDRRGVGEPINETGLDGKGLIIRGSHYLLFDTIEQSTVDQRVLGEALMLRPELLFVEDSGSPSDFMDKYFTNFTGVKAELPMNAHLLTLSALGDGDYLLRLEHQFELDEGILGKPVNVSLSDLFKFEISSVTELVLGGNANYPVKRLQWKTVTESTGGVRERRSVTGPKYTVELHPMEIRTFKMAIHFDHHEIDTDYRMYTGKTYMN